MAELRELIGKIVKYRDANYCIRYGELRRTDSRVTVRDKQGNKHTVKGVIVRYWDGVEYGIPLNNVLAWMHYKVERSLDWRPLQSDQG